MINPSSPPLPPTGTQAGGTPLHWASREGHLEVVKELVASKANVNAKDRVSGEDTVGANTG